MSSHTHNRTTVRELNSGWRFHDVRPNGASPDTALLWLPATVPGHVHVDLVDAGVIADPFERMAERGAQWVDDTDWLYETTFHLAEPPAAHTSLLFEGLDTVAEITLNGSSVGSTDNMLIAHEFPVAGLLKYGGGSDGDNVLQI